MKQTSISISSVDAKYMTMSMTSCESIWLHKLVIRLFDHELEPMVILYDNQSCIKFYENPIFHDRSKHIEMGITASETISKREKQSFNMFPQMRRLQIF